MSRTDSGSLSSDPVDGPVDESDTNTTCGRCGTKFRCDYQAGCESCWCLELPKVLSPTNAEACLCRDCLVAEIETAAKNGGTRG